MSVRRILKCACLYIFIYSICTSYKLYRCLSLIHRKLDRYTIAEILSSTSVTGARRCIYHYLLSHNNPFVSVFLYSSLSYPSCGRGWTACSRCFWQETIQSTSLSPLRQYRGVPTSEWGWPCRWTSNTFALTASQWVWNLLQVLLHGRVNCGVL